MAYIRISKSRLGNWIFKKDHSSMWQTCIVDSRDPHRDFINIQLNIIKLDEGDHRFTWRKASIPFPTSE